MRRSNEGNASNLDGSPEKHSRQVMGRLFWFESLCYYYNLLICRLHGLYFVKASSSSSSSGSVPIALASTSTDESDTKKNEDNASGASSTLSSQPDSVELSRAKNEVSYKFSLVCMFLIKFFLGFIIRMPKVCLQFPN